MPMNKKDYSDNWEEIAKTIKDEANWTCQQCGKPCRRPGMSWWEFVESLGDSKWYDQTFEEISNNIGESGIVEKKQRFTLTVSHKNHIPLDCRRENLQALCSVCHLKYDAPHHAQTRRANKRKAQERDGQLRLL
jgi:hypothetical protein